MDKYEFNTKFCDELEKALEGMGGHVSVGSVQKNNVLLQAATVRFGDGPVGVVVYPEHYYEDYRDGIPMQDIISGVRESVAQASTMGFSLDGITREAAPGHLRAAAANYENNREWLEGIPHERLQDLAVYAKWDFGPDYSAKISDAWLQKLQMTKEEVLSMAKANTAKSMRMVGLNELMEGLCMGMAGGLPECGVHVLMTSDGRDGAALVASPEALKTVHAETGDFYILPSSVHEVLVYPRATNPIPPEDLREMVREINQTEVPIQDRLSDNVYEYDGHSLKIAGMDGLAKDTGIPDALTHRRKR